MIGVIPTTTSPITALFCLFHIALLLNAEEASLLPDRPELADLLYDVNNTFPDVKNRQPI